VEHLRMMILEPAEPSKILETPVYEYPE
jgi:hypothetical protein